MNKTKIFTVTAVAVAAAGVTGAFGYLGVSQVMAAVANNGHNTLIENLAKKFNVSTTDVQSVFDETRTAEETARLDQAVKDGQITEAQKALIVVKQKELETKIQEINNKQLTTTERQTALQQVQDDLNSWATTNKIPSYLLRGGGMGGHRGQGGFEMMGGKGMM
jgi:hypothetical protein